MSLEAIKYQRGQLDILDQLLLPSNHEFIKMYDTTDAWNAIKKMQVTKFFGWCYTHDRRADRYPYPHDRRADKDSYPHDMNVTDDLCSLIKLCFAFIMVNFST